jgi:RHS repeat-associated protein
MYGNVSRTIDANNAATTTSYDRSLHVLPTEICNALNQCKQQLWDVVIGRPLTETDANQFTTSHTYDVLARETLTRYPNGGAQHHEYYDTELGDPTRQHVRSWLEDGSADGLWTDTYFDGLARTYAVVSKGDAAGVTFEQDTTFSDASTNQYTQSHPYSLSNGSNQSASVLEQSTYNERSQVLQVRHADGSSQRSEYRYDASGTWTTVTNEIGHAKTTLTDRDGHVRQVLEDSNGKPLKTEYKYDALGRVTQAIDADGNVITAAKWNSLGQKLSQTDADMGTWSYEYDAVGNLIHQTDARGILTSFEYDPLRRPTRQWWTHSNGDIVEAARWIYDETGEHGAGIGRLTTVSDPSAGTCRKASADAPFGISDSLTYDPVGNTIQRNTCILGSSYGMQFRFDHVGTGRQDGVTYPDGEVVLSHFDAAGRLNDVADQSQTGQSLTTFVESAKHDAAGRVVVTDYGNGSEEQLTYDPARGWEQSERLAYGGQTLYEASYSYSANGLLAASASSTGKLNLTYGYDSLNRLTEVSGDATQTFAYDDIGNIRVNSALGRYEYQSPAPHAVTSVGATLYSYDADGNMTTRAGASISWDENNRPEDIQAPNGTSTHILYNAEGERVYVANSADGVHHYIGTYVDVKLSGDHVSPDEATKYYYAGGERIGKSANGVITWYQLDRLGSVRALVDNEGKVIERVGYTAFGASSTESGQTTPGSSEPGFRGQIQDTNSGLLYMGARYYDPSLARFISPDSVIPDRANPQSLNRYSFVYNTPTMFTDPSGHVPEVSDQQWRDWYWAQWSQGVSLTADQLLQTAQVAANQSAVNMTLSAQPAVPDYIAEYISNRFNATGPQVPGEPETAGEYAEQLASNPEAMTQFTPGGGASQLDGQAIDPWSLGYRRTVKEMQDPAIELTTVAGLKMIEVYATNAIGSSFFPELGGYASGVTALAQTSFRGESSAMENVSAKIAGALENGISPRGGETAPATLDNLVESINQTSKRATSGWVQASEDFKIAVFYATNNGKRSGVVYEIINGPNSVVTAENSVARMNNYPEQLVVGHAGGVAPSQIVRAYVVDKNGAVQQIVERGP